MTLPRPCFAWSALTLAPALPERASDPSSLGRAAAQGQ
jgi:hypothetical protein